MFKLSSVCLESFSLTFSLCLFFHGLSSHWWHSCSLTQDIPGTRRFPLPPPGISRGSQMLPLGSGLWYSAGKLHVSSVLRFTKVLLLTSFQGTEWKPWVLVGLGIDFTVFALAFSLWDFNSFIWQNMTPMSFMFLLSCLILLCVPIAHILLHPSQPPPPILVLTPGLPLLPRWASSCTGTIPGCPLVLGAMSLSPSLTSHVSCPFL